MPWAHLDIAGTAWDTGREYVGKGATGFGVRLLVRLAREPRQRTPDALKLRRPGADSRSMGAARTRADGAPHANGVRHEKPDLEPLGRRRPCQSRRRSADGRARGRRGDALAGRDGQAPDRLRLRGARPRGARRRDPRRDRRGAADRLHHRRRALAPRRRATAASSSPPSAATASRSAPRSAAATHGELREAGAAAATAMTELDPGEPPARADAALRRRRRQPAGDDPRRPRHRRRRRPAGRRLRRRRDEDGAHLPDPRRRGDLRRRGRPRRSPPTGRSGSAGATAGSGSASRCWSPARAGNRVIEIDDRPALDVYLEQPRRARRGRRRPARVHPLGAHPPARAGPAAQRPRAGALRRRGRLRGALDRLHRRGPRRAGWPGSCTATPTRSCARPRRPARDAIGALGGAPPLGIIAFDCIGRRGVLGDERIAEEVESDPRLRRRGARSPASTPTARSRGVKGVNALHSQTFVAMAIG